MLRNNGRRHSDSCVLRVVTPVDEARVPPLHNEEIIKQNVWEEKLSEEKQRFKSEFHETDIEDDWFAKLSSQNERTPSEAGIDSSQIPLLPGKESHFKEKTLRTLRVGLKKIWKRGSITITEADPIFKVIYLGNVVTGWAKGEGCIDKPLATLWKNYNSSSKPDVHMKITITQSGLKAITKEHGLTEYWSNRTTFCSAPSGYPRVFCWVYRHEGRKLKQELRCHAVLCSKESIARNMAATLRLRISQALLEFKRDKILRQNARLSLANSVYENPSLPRRKILLSTGSHVYKPPLERSKSAPKLMVIEESLEEDEVQKLVELEEECDDEEEDADTEEKVLVKNTRVPETKSEKRQPSNLNFVKKFCSSIENLVENTSSYGRKLLHERRVKEFNRTNQEEKKKPILISRSLESLAQADGENYAAKRRHRKSVSFEDDKDIEKCLESKLQEDIIEVEENIEDVEEVNQRNSDLEREQTTNDLVMSFRDSEQSDDSLQSVSSGSSSGDFHEKLVVLEEDGNNFSFNMEAERRRFMDGILCDKLQDNADNDVFLMEEKVILHPKGGRAKSTGRKYVRSQTFPPYDKLGEQDSYVSDEEEDDEEEVVSDESGYVELNELVIKRLSLDSKEKDLPYYQIIKSNELKPRPLESSCLQV